MVALTVSAEVTGPLSSRCFIRSTPSIHADSLVRCSNSRSVSLPPRSGSRRGIAHNGRARGVQQLSGILEFSTASGANLIRTFANREDTAEVSVIAESKSASPPTIPREKSSPARSDNLPRRSAHFHGSPEIRKPLVRVAADSKSSERMPLTWFSRQLSRPAALQSFANWNWGCIPSSPWREHQFSCRDPSRTRLHPG